MVPDGPIQEFSLIVVPSACHHVVFGNTLLKRKDYENHMAELVEKRRLSRVHGGVYSSNYRFRDTGLRKYICKRCFAEVLERLSKIR